MTSVPMMSDGIRSGVNWMRLNLRCTASRQRLDQQRLRQPRHAAQQHVTAGEERHENFLDDRLLADDRVAELVPQTRREALRLVELHRAKLYRGSCTLEP